MVSGCMAATVKELSSGEISFQGLTAATVFVLPVNLYLEAFFCMFENPLGAKAFSSLRSAVFASLTKMLLDAWRELVMLRTVKVQFWEWKPRVNQATHTQG